MTLSRYRGPLAAGLLMLAGIGWWALQERDAVRQRHRAELRRFVDGVLLALDASHDLLRPHSRRPGQRPLADRPTSRPEGAGPPRSQPNNLQQLEPVLQRMVEARPRVRAVAVFRDDTFVTQAGELPPFSMDGFSGDTLDGGLFIAWRPLGAPSRPQHDSTGRRPRAGGQSEGRTVPRQPPPGAPMVVIAVEAEMPAGALRRNLLQIGQKVGLAAVGTIALLLAWVQGARSRALVHRLEAEKARRSHLEELSLAASGLAHETKNPLGIIRGLAQRMESAGDLPERHSAAAGQILEEADRAVARLGEFMSYARVRTPELKKTNSRQLLIKAAAVLESDLESAGVTMSIEAGDAIIMADEEMLLQILLNLMLNSLEASPEGGVMTLRLATAGGRARLSVEDRGQGVDPELRERLFKPYVTSRAQGHGLGLAIVKRLVESHGWSIEMDSRPKSGTIMTITGIRIAGEMENTR